MVPILTRSGQWRNIGQLKEGDGMAESVERRTYSGPQERAARVEVNARIEDSRDEDQGLVSRAAFEAFPPRCCLGVHHWRNVAGHAFANAREKSVAFNWTGSCVTCDCAVAE